jgi:uncharacterized membrane protein YbhN (UPF0104 family)
MVGKEAGSLPSMAYWLAEGENKKGWKHSEMKATASSLTLILLLLVVQLLLLLKLLLLLLEVLLLRNVWIVPLRLRNTLHVCPHVGEPLSRSRFAARCKPPAIASLDRRGCCHRVRG